MKIAVGSDHAGFLLKQHLAATAVELGHEIIDLGTDSEASVSYVPYCAAVGRAVAKGEADRGIVCGGSGQGEQLAANKVRGVRAALCTDAATAAGARKWNDANVLVMGLRLTAPEVAREMLDAWFETDADPSETENIDRLERA